MPVLKVSSLNKTYPSSPPFVAVKDISFELEEGEILGILGPNGAGKTTTLQMLLGILTPTSGQIVYFGKDFKTHRSHVLEKIAFASAYVSLAGNMTIEQNLQVFGRLYGLKGKEIKARMDKYLKIFGLESKKDTYVSMLSAGQMTRAMLIKAFMIEPKILLLDEPTASLDPDIAKEVLELILHVRKEKKMSILFTSHKMSEVSEICDRILFMKEGKIIANDKPDKLAKSVKSSSICLIVVDGLKRAESIAKEMGLIYKTEHRNFCAEIENESDIAKFLHKLALKEVVYSHIEIHKPTLEDYFLQMSKKGAFL